MAEIWTMRLKALFESSGLTIRDVARISGIPKSACQRYISGETGKIPIDRIKALSKVFGVSSEFIMGLDNDNHNLANMVKAIQKNPKLALLFDKTGKLSSWQLDIMLNMADTILREKDDY